MARISNSATIGKAVAALASHQHGVVARGQLRGLGLTDDAILRWLRDHRIHRVRRGVYAVGHASLEEKGRLLAAALGCGPGAVISHRSAAFLLEIGKRSPQVIDVIAPGQHGRKFNGIRVHNVPYPAPSECLLVAGIPCTNPARTVVDLAGTYGEIELGRTIEQAATGRKLDIAAIDAILTAGPRRRGAPCLRRVLVAWRPAATAEHTTFRSLFEARLLPLMVKAGLPLPRHNAPVHTAERILEVDLLWERERFVVEADSRLHHGIEIAFDRDRRRDRELLAVRHQVLRVTWREVEHEADAVFAVIRGELRRRGS